MYCTYVIINLKNNKMYVGYTKNFKLRQKQHFTQKFWRSEPNKILYKAMKKHKIENFLMFFMETYDTEIMAKQAEVDLIATLKKDKIILYNMTKGGGGGHVLKPNNTKLEKECFNCKEIKPNSKFYESKNSFWGYMYECKDCVKIRRAQNATRKRIDKTGSAEFVHSGLLLNTETEKYCNNCEIVKPRTDFYTNSNAPDNTQSDCIECKNKKDRKNRTGTEEYTQVGWAFNSEKEKYCPSCKTVHPRTLDHFYKNKSSSDGLSSVCKKCFKEKY